MNEKEIVLAWIQVKKVACHDKESFINKVLNNPDRNETILKIRAERNADERERLKKTLPGVCWNVECFTDGMRHNESAVPGVFFAVDFDRKDNPHMGDAREYFNNHIKPLIGSLRIVWVEQTVNYGLHVVALRPNNSTIAAAQQHLATLVGLKHDPACKDESRLVIIGHKDEIFHADWDAVFGAKESEPYTLDTSEDETLAASLSPFGSMESIDCVRAKKFFDVDLGSIFDAYVGTEPIPAGVRNATVFGKSRKLLTLGVSLRDLVTLFRSVTELSETELKQACRIEPSAASIDGKLAPELRRIIRGLREERGLETGAGLLPCRPLPRNLPPLIRVLAAVAPRGMDVPLIILSLSILGFLGTGARLRYLDGALHYLSFMTHVVGKFAGGKSTLIKWLNTQLLSEVKERDNAARQIERAYVEECRKCKSDERKPDDPKPLIRLVPITISVAQLLKRLDQARGLHIFSLCEEIDTAQKTNKAGAWSEKTDIYRVGFDGGEFGQDFLSDASYSGIYQVLYNILSGGTASSTSKFFDAHVMDGLVSRVAFTCIPDDFAAEIPCFKPLNARQTAEIEQGIKALEAAEGEVKIPRTLKAIQQWLAEKRRLAMETMSIAIDAFYKRSAVMGARAGAVAFILNGGRENNAVAAFAQFVADYVLQQQVFLWGFKFENEAETAVPCSLANLYRELPETFTRKELVNLRVINGQGTNVRQIIHRWKQAGMIQEVEKKQYVKTSAQVSA